MANLTGIDGAVVELVPGLQRRLAEIQALVSDKETRIDELAKKMNRLADDRTKLRNEANHLTQLLLWYDAATVDLPEPEPFWKRAITSNSATTAVFEVIDATPGGRIQFRAATDALVQAIDAHQISSETKDPRKLAWGTIAQLVRVGTVERDADDYISRSPSAPRPDAT